MSGWMMRLRGWSAALCGLALAGGMLAGCATQGAAKPSPGAAQADAKPLPKGLDPASDSDPFPSTYKPLPAPVTAIVGAIKNKSAA